ncbi:MAG: T9SS type A sorting domain-containing protein, partial [Calditrichaeota bacterium]|nr:T9SS type A sorting domain-containing protein [Calditrichota bacterium]
GGALAVFYGFLNGDPPTPCLGQSSAPEASSALEIQVQNVVYAKPGEQITIPVDLVNPNNDPVDAFGLKFNYSSDFLQFQAVSDSGTLAEGWSFSAGKDTLSATTIGASDGTPTTASGVLYNLVFQVDSTAAGIDSLYLSEIVDGIENATIKNGVIKVAPDDIKSLIIWQRSEPIWTPGANTYEYNLRIKNDSQVPISTPLLVEITNLNPPPPDVTVVNADNGESDIGAIFDFSDLVGGDNVLSPGEVTGPKLFKYQLTSQMEVTVDVDFFGVLPAGSAPVMSKQNISPPNSDRLGFAAEQLPKSYALHQNYPNPFNPETRIQYQLSEASAVQIKIFNLAGQLVRSFEAGLQPAGVHSVVWDSKDNLGQQVSSGVYLYQFIAEPLSGNGERFEMIRKFTLLR